MSLRRLDLRRIAIMKKNSRFKYTCKKVIYYPRELYYKIIPRRKRVYFTEFEHDGKFYRILNDCCSVTVLVPRIIKDDLKIYAFFAKQSLAEIINKMFEDFLENQDLVEFFDEYKVLAKDDIVNYQSSADLIKQQHNIKENDDDNHDNKWFIN